MGVDDKDDFYELLRNMGRGIKRHGVKKVIRALKQINLDSDNEYNFNVIEFVEKSVCSKIGVPRDELFGFATRGEITIARKLCILLVRNNLKISDDELGSHYNRTRQVIHNTEKEFKLLVGGKKNKFHKDFLRIYYDLEAEIKAFVETLKKSNQWK